MISNIVSSNSAASTASMFSGIPENVIERYETFGLLLRTAWSSTLEGPVEAVTYRPGVLLKVCEIRRGIS